ncbi:MAG: ATP-binding protein [Mediterranea sp.]|jgi:predicted ATPase|nr:ATP-binding protein [Mediterranea sp.]
MSRIKIKNFGPIKEGLPDNEGWIDIKKVTVFIGNQGSGKSSIAKLISTFSWIEKVLTRGDFSVKEFTARSFKNKYCEYHRISNYFIKEQTEIHYEGDSYNFTYTAEGNFIIEKAENGLNGYPLPQIMYVPAERNFISMMNLPSLIKELPESLVTFLSEYDKAKENIDDHYRLPINGAQLKYNRQSKVITIIGDDYDIKLQEASSGFQSLVPLYIVSDYLHGSVEKQAENSTKMSSDETRRFEEGVRSIWDDNTLSDAQRRAALSALSSRFNKSAFINIVEEPEQNLFPSSQEDIMRSLLEFNNSLDANKLIITTHSPYLTNFLTVAVKAGILKEEIENKKDEGLLAELDDVFSLNAAVNKDDIAIYELEEKHGTVELLKTTRGLPADDNFLNSMLDDSNELFAELLGIQQKL